VRISTVASATKCRSPSYSLRPRTTSLAAHFALDQTERSGRAHIARSGALLRAVRVERCCSSCSRPTVDATVRVTFMSERRLAQDPPSTSSSFVQPAIEPSACRISEHDHVATMKDASDAMRQRRRQIGRYALRDSHLVLDYFRHDVGEKVTTDTRNGAHR